MSLEEIQEGLSSQAQESLTRNKGCRNVKLVLVNYTGRSGMIQLLAAIPRSITYQLFDILNNFGLHFHFLYFLTTAIG